MKKTAAFFDIDGTLYRDSLMIEHFKKLIKYELIDARIWSEHLKSTYMNWDKRQGNYDDYLFEISNHYQNAIKGLEKRDVDFTSDQVIRLKADRVYKYTRSQIKWHLDRGHVVIFISGSPDFLVSRMAGKYGVSDFVGSTYEVEDGKMTGRITPMWDSRSKNIAIDRLVQKHDIDLENSYAYGDTNGDLCMLGKVGRPIAINPSKELLNHIQMDACLSEKTKIVVERKDVIYVLKPGVEHIEENGVIE